MDKAPISIEGFTRPPRLPAMGPAPQLQWIKIADLVVDPSYQRAIARQGRENVHRIAAGFDWTKFAPVIVAPIEGGLFAIVDGQHRTTAAALVGVMQVPCLVVLADGAGQAAAFRAINGATTKVHPLALHHAAVQAGDVEACALHMACLEAGVVILRYPRAKDRINPGETLALEVLSKGWRALGDRKFKRALTCVTATRNNVPGALCADVLRALFHLGDRIGAAEWDDLVRTFGEIDLLWWLQEAQALKATSRDVRGVWLLLADQLDGYLEGQGL